MSAYKAKEAAKAAPLDASVKAELHKVTEAQLAKRGKIKRPTALLVDKSGSMTEAIELYRALGFGPIAPYRHNPVPGAMFLELDLGLPAGE